MLSSRGRKYAALNLAASYKKDRGQLYDRVKHPNGLVSFANAENVSLDCLVGRSVPHMGAEQV